MYDRGYVRDKAINRPAGTRVQSGSFPYIKEPLGVSGSPGLILPSFVDRERRDLPVLHMHRLFDFRVHRLPRSIDLRHDCLISLSLWMLESLTFFSAVRGPELSHDLASLLDPNWTLPVDHYVTSSLQGSHHMMETTQDRWMRSHLFNQM
jgi:hypothetical protein